MDRCEKIGGSTAIYVRDSLPFKTHSDLMINELENCMIEILRPKTKKLFICCVFRGPNKPLENYISQLNSVILQTGGGPPLKEPSVVQEKIMKLFEGTPLLTGLDGFETVPIRPIR